jgi:sialate O-acetylesterase
LAAALVHHDPVAARSPSLAAATQTGNGLSLRFADIGTGLMVAGTGLKGFELAGADGVFKPAQASLNADGGVTVAAAGIPVPVAGRYNWAAVPLGNLFSREGLPAAPFQVNIANGPMLPTPP